jgi:hypothetical protein
LLPATPPTTPPATGADSGLGALDQYGADRFDDPHADVHFAAGLRARVGRPRLAAGAAGEQGGGEGSDGKDKQTMVHCEFPLVRTATFDYQGLSPNAKR